MNVFLPYSSDLQKSVQTLDNARLIKQILEIKILLDNAIAYERVEVPNSYYKHPVAQFFKDKPYFLCLYGIQCCFEYFYRYHNIHRYYDFFVNQKAKHQTHDHVLLYPYYMEGSKDSPNCIRTINPTLVDELFKAKLISKWIADKRSPNWGNRGTPKFYSDYLKFSKEERENYWAHIKQLKTEAKNE